MARAVETWTAPRHSAIGASRIDGADFECAHRVPLVKPDIAVTDIFHAIFAHRPFWLKRMLLVRNRIAASCGLETSSDEDVLRIGRRTAFAVGELIGGWPVHFLSDVELVAGRDNQHMDFRLSIMKAADNRSAIVSTVCWTRNPPGRAYLAVVAPLHRIGFRALISAAIEGGRL
jgi:hypothetical protein